MTDETLADIRVVGLVYDFDAYGYRAATADEAATTWAVYRKFHDRIESVDRHELGKPTKTYFTTHAEATTLAIIATAQIAAQLCAGHNNQGERQ